VFADVGLPDAEDLLLKAELAHTIARIIRERKLTQRQAGELIGMAQPNVSDLVRGRLDNFGVERLLVALTALDHDVTISVAPAKQAGGRIRLAATT
jgi:predicted XRE-type DNA-binding protein